MILNQIDPTRESIKDLVANYPKDTPVAMLNILRFKEKVDGGEESGKEAYKRYSANASKHIEASGAKILWAGQVCNAFIGDAGTMPHQVFIVEYASVDDFLNMVMAPDYQAFAGDRTIALEYGGLFACKTINNI